MRRRLVFLLIGIAIAAISAQFLTYSGSSFAKTTQSSGGSRISPNELPEDSGGSSLLTIGATGRYSIRSKSASGVQIQLVDMIAGPLEASGSPGLKDGRIDALLEAGVYKIRLHAVKGSKGKAVLSVEPFVEADVTRPKLTAGQLQKAELTDLQQRSYSIESGFDQPVIIEAAGRSLKDIRVWQSDGGLVDLKITRRVMETKPGRAMTILRLEGQLPSGRYTVTAYGGEKQLWSDGSTEQPFLIRLTEEKTLAAGVVTGKVGPFGVEIFDAPSQYNAFRLELPRSAQVSMSAQRGDVIETGQIDKTNRSAVTIINLLADDKNRARVEVVGVEGQPYKLEALRFSDRATYQAVGQYRVMVDLAGDGGDEVQAAAIFARFEDSGAYRVLASNTPKIGPGVGWRSKFNFLGTISLLFEVTQKGPIFLNINGPKYRMSLAPALGSFMPRADGAVPLRYDLNPGFYFLTLQPEADAGGVLDVTIGPPGVQAPLSSPSPSRSFIPLGEHKLEKGGSYIILSNVAPELLTGPRIFQIPITLDNQSFSFVQEPNKETILPVNAPKGAKLIAVDQQGEKVSFTIVEEKAASNINILQEKMVSDARQLVIKFAASPVERTIGLMSQSQQTARQAVEKQEASPATRIAPGRPGYFDLGLNESKSIRIDVAEGGLYRLETLGRLMTSLKLGSPVLNILGEGDKNGIGKNAQLATFLRAGSYYADVTTSDVAGHLGISVSPVPLVTTAKLRDNGIVAAALSPEKGASIPFEISQAGEYELQLLGLNHQWIARIEDAEGWPIKRPGRFTKQTLKFEPGAYRLVVSPEAVEGRLVARLNQIKPAPALEGHGPHLLPFNSAQKLQWREPVSQTAPRTPDQWLFSLLGASDIELSISEGMIAEVFRGDKELVGKATQDRPLKINLSANDYRIEARSLAHDDRVDYEIKLASAQLQSGVTERISLPATLEFSFDKAKIVDIASFGPHEVLGVIKTSSGEVFDRIKSNGDNWNLSFSRPMPPGQYRLEIEELSAKKVAQGGVFQSKEPDDEQDDTAETNDASVSDEGTNSDNVVDLSGDTEIRLSVIEERKEQSLPEDGKLLLEGSGGHNISFVPGKSGALNLVTTQSALETILSVERRDNVNSEWKSVGLTRGTFSVLALPSTDEKALWRIMTWAAGGAPAQIALTSQTIEMRESSLGKVSLEAVKGVPSFLCFGKIAAPKAAVLQILSQSPVFAGSTPGSPLRLVTDPAYAPQSGSVWLMGLGECSTQISASAIELGTEEIFIDLASGEKAQLPELMPSSDKTRVWFARSAFAQPMITAGNGEAIGSGVALALAGSMAPKVWRADEIGSMRFSLNMIDLANQKPIKSTTRFSGVIAPMSAQLIEMAQADGALAVDVSGGLAAFVGQRGIYAETTGASRVFNHAGDSVILVNPTDKVLSAQITRVTEPSTRIDSVTNFKRFIGSSGEVSLPFEGQSGDRLNIVGAEGVVIFQNGRMLRGKQFALDGKGEVILRHTPGLVAAWIERSGVDPWPRSEMKAITLPVKMSMEGPSMRFAIKQQAPAQLNIKSDTPALVSFTQKNQHTTQAFASGIDFHHYIAAGDATIEIVSPHTGNLSGALDISTQSIVAAKEGINEPVVISSGASVLFAFETTRDADIGIGLRANPDRISARVLDATGSVLGEGIAQKIKVSPGRYYIEALAPPDAGATTVRLTLLGISPPPVAPPEEAVSELLDKAGLKKTQKK